MDFFLLKRKKLKLDVIMKSTLLFFNATKYKWRTKRIFRIYCFIKQTAKNLIRIVHS